MTMDKKQMKQARREQKQREEWERLHKASTPWERFRNSMVMSFKILYRNKKAFVGFLILVVFLLMATVGPVFIKLDTTWTTRAAIRCLRWHTRWARITWALTSLLRWCMAPATY